MNGERVRLVVADGVARLTLVRPAAGNAFDARLVDELATAVELLHTTSDIRALLIDAEGRNFTVGGDLKFLGADLDRLTTVVDGMIATWHDTVMPRLDTLPFPVVTAVQGSAAGGGLGLVWAADIVVAADDLRIVTGFDKLGFSGDGGSTWHLPRLVGLRRAQQIIIGGESVDASRALDWGLVTQVVPRAELADVAAAAAARLAAGPTRAYARMRRLLLQSSTTSHHQQLADERRAMWECSHEPDVREGITAFVERRRPRFGSEVAS